MAGKKATTKESATQEFAVIHTGGKQYKVSVGDSVKIEKLKGEFQAGDKVIFDKVMLVDNGSDTSIGMPYIDGATVEGIFEKSGRAQKVTVIRYKQKSRYFKKNGHKQPFVQVKISAIK